MIVPLDASVKLTDNGAVPLVGLPEKLAAGGTAPEPVTALVEFPPLLAKTMLPEKSPSLPGLKATDTVAVWPPPMLYELVLVNVNAESPVTNAVPVNVSTPSLITEKSRLATSWMSTWSRKRIVKA